MSAVTQTLSDLIALNSVNPEWGGPGEAAVAEYVSAFFGRHGIGVEQRPVLPGRANVIARLPGRARGHSLLFECHMDTVGVDGMSIPPFEPRIRDGRLSGRGACDVKAGLAAMLHAIASIKNDGLSPAIDLVFAAVVDEEHRFRGVTALIESMEERPRAAVVAEPTELKIVRANKGVLRWRIIAHGRAAHSSRPELGADAITAMADLVRAIREENLRLRSNHHPLVGPPTCNVGLIEGGEQINFVPARCVISLDRRMIPGEDVADVVARYRELADGVAEEHDGVRFEMEQPSLADAAMETPADADVVRQAAATASRLGMDPQPIGVPFGCDCTKLSRAGIPSIIFGPGSIAQAHTGDEWVDLAEVEKAVDFYRELALHYGNP